MKEVNRHRLCHPTTVLLEAKGGKAINYMILYPETCRARKVVIAGGGDSALDWALFLGEICSELTLVHRSEAFSAAHDSVSKVMKRAEEGKINLQLNSNLTSVNGDDV